MQSPQFPTVQEYGIGSPAASPASSSVWPGSTTTVPTACPFSSTVISRGPYGNAFAERRTRLGREADARRLADQGRARTWHVVNPEKVNRLGRPVGTPCIPRASRSCSPTTPPASTTAPPSPPSTCG